MQEALGIMLGAFAALLVASCGVTDERAPALASHGAASGSNNPRGHASRGGWMSISLALLSCVLMVGMAAWSVLGLHRSAELARNSMQQQEQNRYVAPGPKASWFLRIPSDGVDKPRRSRLVVKEDGKPLGPAHSLHADIAETGGGRFSHWDSWVVFRARITPTLVRTAETTPSVSDCFPVLSPGCSRSLCSSD